MHNVRDQVGEQSLPRHAILWSAVAFLAVAVGGLILVPGLRLLWVILLFFGVAAVPSALRRNR